MARGAGLAVLRVRKATLRDVRLMAELERSCFDEGYPESLLAYFVMNDERFICLLAELGGIAVGMAIGELEEEGLKAVGHVWTIEVLAPYRRRGIGERLLRELEERLRARGAVEFHLEVKVGNEPAIRLYEKMGYIKVGILRDYYGPGQDGIFMVKHLGPGEGPSKWSCGAC